jgi:hypothetical protein
MRSARRCQALFQDSSARAHRSPDCCDRSRLVATIGVFCETRALDPHDAEALAGRRFQHHPALKPICDLGSQFLQPRDLGGVSSVSMSMWTRLSCSTRWISTIGSSGGSPARGNCRASLDASGCACLQNALDRLRAVRRLWAFQGVTAHGAAQPAALLATLADCPKARSAASTTHARRYTRDRIAAMTSVDTAGAMPLRPRHILAN